MNQFEFLDGARWAFQKLHQLSGDSATQKHCLLLAAEAQRQLAALPSSKEVIVFNGIKLGEWLIGPEGGARRFQSGLDGLSPAWMAIAYGSVRLSDFKKPDTARFDIGRAIRVQAADWIERTAQCHPLANILRGIKVVNGHAIYTRRPHDPVILTGL